MPGLHGDTAEQLWGIMRQGSWQWCRLDPAGGACLLCKPELRGNALKSLEIWGCAQNINDKYTAIY